MQANRLQAIHYMYSLYTCVQVILYTLYVPVYIIQVTIADECTQLLEGCDHIQ